MWAHSRKLPYSTSKPRHNLFASEVGCIIVGGTKLTMRCSMPIQCKLKPRDLGHVKGSMIKRPLQVSPIPKHGGEVGLTISTRPTTRTTTDRNVSLGTSRMPEQTVRMGTPAPGITRELGGLRTQRNSVSRFRYSRVNVSWNSVNSISSIRHLIIISYLRRP